MLLGIMKTLLTLFILFFSSSIYSKPVWESNENLICNSFLHTIINKTGTVEGINQMSNTITFSFDNNKAMSGFGNSNSSMPFGNMPDINDLLKNPGQMNDIMKNVNNLMSNMNNNNNKRIIPQLNSSSASTSEINIDNKPMMDDDLFNKINNYIENENVDEDENEDKKLFKKTMWETKKINNKLKKRNKNKKKVSTDEFNDVKNMTIALEDVLKQLKNH